MAGDTQITVIGSLGGDPALSFTQSGVAVASFSVASTPRAFNKLSNEWKDGETLWLRCTAWRTLAENVAESLTKGARVIVHGRLQQRSYEKDGQTRTVIELQVDEIGPSLTFATAKVNRTARGSDSGRSISGQAQSESDPWGAAPSTDAPPF